MPARKSLSSSPVKSSGTTTRKRLAAVENCEDSENSASPSKKLNPVVELERCDDSGSNQTPKKGTPSKTRKAVKESPVGLVSTPTKKRGKENSKIKPVVHLQSCLDEKVEEIKDIFTKKRRASMKPSLDDVAEVSTEDDDDDTREALSMYGKYGKIIGNRKQSDEDGPMFGFATPKKNNMHDRTNLALSASKKTPVSKAMNRNTPRKTPCKGVATPLSKLKLRGDAPATPKSVRKKITSKIEQQLESSSSEDDEDESDSDSDSDESIKPLEKPAAEKVDTDDFFEKQGSKKIVTSDKTLNQLRTPRLSPEVLRSLLEHEPLKHEKAIEAISQRYKKLFLRWMHFLSQDFSVVLYGLGSKRNLLNDFHHEMLSQEDCVVINGFFPSLTMKHVLGVILNDILHYSGNVGTSLTEQAENILRCYSGDSVADDLYLVVHNIDGPMLRNESAQSILSSLAGHSRIHLICSVDHINAPLLWDQNKLSNYNFTWQDATTFLPYSEETLNENSLMVRSGGAGLALHSLMRVFESLTPNAKEIYLLIVNTQMKAVEEVGLSFYSGLSFKDLYRQCRRAFLVNSDLTLRAQLTEFIDHKLIRNKKGVDGMEYLIIPLENQTLLEFIEKYKNTA